MLNTIVRFTDRQFPFAINLDHLCVLQRRQMNNEFSDYLALMNAPGVHGGGNGSMGFQLSHEDTTRVMERMSFLRSQMDFKRYQYVTTPEFIIPVGALVAIQESGLPHIGGGSMPYVTLINGLNLPITSADYTDLMKQLKGA